MKIKEIANNIELHKTEDGLALMANNKVLLQGFTDIGTLANGLVPIIYYKQQQQQFKYLDTDTLEIFDISNVNWISGFHYVGSNLTYLGHNYRTDPTAKLANNEYVFNTGDQDLINEIAKLKGYSSRNRVKSKYDAESDSFIKFKSDEIEHVFTADLFTELLNSIKYIRIVGKGFLAKGLNIGSRPIKLEDGSNYNSSFFTLSQKDETYGVIDVRTNKLITEIIHKEIDVCPNLIRVDSDTFLKY